MSSSSTTTTNNNNNNNNNIWSTKLTKRLASLTTNASRESLQTISRWLIFHRKQCQFFTSSLLSLLITSSSSSSSTTTTKTTTRTMTTMDKMKRKMLYLSVIHELLIANSSRAVVNNSVVTDGKEVQQQQQQQQEAVAAGGGGGGPISEVRWEKMSVFRCMIGEVLIGDVMEHLGECLAYFSQEEKKEEEEKEQVLQKVKNMMDTWEVIDAFGGPSIVEDARRALERGLKSVVMEEQQRKVLEEEDDANAMAVEQDEQEENEKETSTAKSDAVSKAADATQETKRDNNNMDTDDTTTKKDETSTATTAATATDTKNDVLFDKDMNVAASSKKEEPPTDTKSEEEEEEEEKEFDFESEGIPYAKVQAKEFLNPCKSIASIQITRDFLNDATLHLSGLLSSIHPSIEQACRDALLSSSSSSTTTITTTNNKKKEEQNQTPKLSSAQLSSLPELSDEILDLNLEEAIRNIQQYRDIVSQQKNARRKCFELLCRSRCRFGSMEAAEKYYEMESMLEKLKKRKIIVEDAMELEGLDMDAIAKDDDDEEEEEEGGSGVEEEIGGKEGSQKSKRKRDKDGRRGFTWYTPNTKKGEGQELEEQEKGRSLKRMKVGA